MFRVLLAMLAVSLFVPALAQSVASGGVSSIPIWPGGGNIPENLRGHNVFLGPTIYEAVLYYSPDAGVPSQRRVVYLQLGNQADVTAFSSVREASGSVLEYHYVLQNSVHSRKAVVSWWLQALGGGGAEAAAHPLWNARVEAAVKERGPLGGSKLTWTAPAGQQLSPGGSLPGFLITSRLRPGFVEACASTSQGTALPPDLPAEVNRQATVLSGPGFGCTVFGALGPRFPQAASSVSVAAELHHGLTRLLKGGQVSNSPFVRDVLELLSQHVISSGTARGPQDLGRISPPSTESEKQVQSVLLLSFAKAPLPRTE